MHDYIWSALLGCALAVGVGMIIIAVAMITTKNPEE